MINCHNEKVKSEFLLGLMEALMEERYEECPRLISAAKSLGAGESQIQEILNSFSEQLHFIPTEKLEEWF